MDDWQDDMTLLMLVDDMGNAKFYGEKHGFGEGMMADLAEVHDSLLDIGPLLQSAESIETMTELMGSSIDDLNGACIAGNEADVRAKIEVAQTAIQAVQAALKP